MSGEEIMLPAPGGEAPRGRYLDPRVLARVSSLTLRARHVVEGVLTGLHRSLHRGQSIEFAEHKEYSQGDEVRHIDWKAFGKKDKYYVKQYEHETNLRAWIVLDSSASMGFPGPGEFGPRGPSMSKFEYGATMAASLAYLMLQQGDAVGCAAFHGATLGYVPPRGQSSHFQAILGALEALRPSEATDLPLCLEKLQEKVAGRGMVVVISDLLGPLEETLKVLRLLRHRKAEVILFHLLSAEEMDLPYTSPAVFVGLEGEGEVFADPAGIRSAYDAELRKFLDRCREGCLEDGIDYCFCRTSDPLDLSLLRYLGRREALR